MENEFKKLIISAALGIVVSLLIIVILIFKTVG